MEAGRVLRRLPSPEIGHQAPAQRRALRGPALTLDHVWLAATLTFAFLAGTLLPADNPDYWWTVKLGEGLWGSGRLPAQDWLAFTATRTPYVEQQWLAQVVLAAVHHVGGLEAASLLRGLLLTLVSAGLFLACRRLGATAAAAAVACELALPLVVGGVAIRPQLLAIPLFTLFLLGTTIWRGRTWTLAALPLAMVLWASLHGSFPMGIVLVGIALVGRGWEVGLSGWRDDALLRPLALLVVLCSLAPLVNPYGPGLLPWLLDYMTFNNGGQGLPTLATEWQPTSLAMLHGRVFFLSLIVLVIVLVRVGPPAPADSLRLLAFGVLALQAERNTLWWGLVMAPILAWGLSQWRRPSSAPMACATDSRIGVPALNALLVAGLLMIAGLSLPWLRPLGLVFGPERWPTTYPGAPVGAANYAATLPATRLYNAIDWGGYLEARLAPRQRIFVDTRFQLYPPQVFHDYFAIAAARPGWEDLLAAYEVDALLVSRTDQAQLLSMVEGDGSWQAVYCDVRSAVYVPRTVAGERAVPCGPEDTLDAHVPPRIPWTAGG
jgi:hypothetical protein